MYPKRGKTKRKLKSENERNPQPTPSITLQMLRFKTLQMLLLTPLIASQLIASQNITVYKTLTAGKCTTDQPATDPRWTYIRNKEKCEAAAAWLKLSKTSASYSTEDEDVDGCYVDTFDYDALKMPSTFSNPGNCAAYYKCLCTFTAPPCTNTDGSIRNAGTGCVCGSSACTTQTGFYCNSAAIAKNRWLRIHTLATAKEPLAAVKLDCIAWQRRQVVTMHRNV